jgi:hypothetical protein
MASSDNAELLAQLKKKGWTYAPPSIFLFLLFVLSI